MTKKQSALRTALALHRFGKQMQAEPWTKECGIHTFTFHGLGYPKYFQTPEQILKLANQIARSLKENI
jgi:hypothetical protein